MRLLSPRIMRRPLSPDDPVDVRVVQQDVLLGIDAGGHVIVELDDALLQRVAYPQVRPAAPDQQVIQREAPDVHRDDHGRYYALAEQRIPYMRDKTVDDRFFILTLFAVAMEAEKQMLNAQDTILQAVLPVGLPPKHYGALYRKFEDYFRGRGVQRFTYKGIPYKVEITDAAAFPHRCSARA